MPMLRSRGGTCSPRSGAATSSPPIEIVPPVGCSRPAIMRRVVVLPQPEGPSSTTISPAAMRKLTSSTAGRPTKNCLRRWVTFSSADIQHFPFRFNAHPFVAAKIPACVDMSESALLPVSVNLVPLVEPALLQAHELFVIRHPHLHLRGIEAFRIGRSLLQ